jgi:hypothetical protein
MFNMGGPIKAGVMHGIREPYAHGTRAALVGNPVYPKTGGREHHVWNLAIPAVRALAGFAIGKGGKTAAGKAFQNVGKTMAGKGTAAAAPVYTGMKGYLMRDPMVKAALWAKNALMSPTSKGWGKSALRFATAPSSLALGAWMGYDKLKGDKADPTVTGVEKPGGYPGAVVEEKAKSLTDEQRKAFALKQREERVQKYLDLMGYDRSKKMAIADALIDASKIVSDRGTLDLKNISRDLINPIIQATSKRLDKPAQIREAVGLMATKAEIEKDLNKETKDLDRRYKEAQIKAAESGLEATESFEGGMKAFLTLRKGAVAANELEQMARLLANEHKEPFTKVTEDTDVTTLDDGIYMSGTKIIRLTDGVPKQLV